MLISFKWITQTRRGAPFTVCPHCKRTLPVWRERGWQGRGPWRTKRHYTALTDGRDDG